MLIGDLIDKSIPSLKPSDTVRKALDLLEDLHLSALPLLEVSGEYWALVDEDRLFDLSASQSLGDIALPYLPNTLRSDQHYFDLLSHASRHSMDLVPVVDSNMSYQGMVTVKDVADALTDSFGIRHQGAIIVLSIKHKDYSLSEISRLVEVNEAKILASLVQTSDPNNLYVTLKIDQLEVSHLVATFERYNYKVAFHNQENSQHQVDVSRVDHLLKYLEI